MSAAMGTPLRTLVVVGNGMVGHRFVEECVAAGLHRAFQIVVLGEETRVAYDRVNLSSYFDGKSAEALSLVAPGTYEEAGITVCLGESAVAVDRARKVVVTARAREIAYDKLVLATGSYAFVPPIPGREARGCFVYRTIDDLDAMRAFAARARIGAVIGGGLLGLEAANAIKAMGLMTHVVEFAPRLMALQVDDPGGTILRRKIERLGVVVHTSARTSEIVRENGAVARLRFEGGKTLETDMVVFSAGIRARDELASAAGLALGARGGVRIDDRCATSDGDILAIGECAAHTDRTFGLVAPGYQMAKVAASTLSGGELVFTGFDMSTKLKLMGVDVASFGDAFATTPGAHVMAFTDESKDTYKKIVLSADRSTLLGGVLVGDASAYGQLHQLAQNAVALPPHPEDFILPFRDGAKPQGFGVDALPPGATICSCHNVTKDTICDAIRGRKLELVCDVKSCTKAGTGCGSCVTLLQDLLKAELKKSGVTVTDDLCEHFAYTRQDLYGLVRVHGIKRFDDLLARVGTGEGCEVCKPAIASILASAWNEHILERTHLPLQDSNDRYLANIQRDGTYSVIPRIPGGELTPDQLIAIGQVAKKYALYTKITGGQRVDLLGARLEQLPDIWRELIQAGLESGHAYGKALRTVKSCVGSTWCRYGVQDSVALAIAVEKRYRGLRSPHKLKSAVSGCARECAEAQSKDFGIIATEKGYNLYLCGNGGMKPQHAQLFAVDVDAETVVRYLDRFLMFYIRTAGRLERTATWFNKLEGGMDYLRRVLIDDSLGICAELEAEMARHIASYECEWTRAIADPEMLRRFRPFVNSDDADSSIVFVEERGQRRPAHWPEKEAAVAPLLAP